MNFYDRLFWWRDNPPVLQPWLGTSYKHTPDLLKWTLALRKGAKFHDGSEITSEDVVYSIERLLDLKTGAAGIFAPFVEPKSTRAVDRYTVEFNINKPFAPFIGLTHFLDILNKKVLMKNEKDGDWGSKWLGMNGSKLGPDGAGSGSFTVEWYRPAVGFDGVRFKDHFFGWNHPHLDEIGYRYVIETASRALGLMKGDYHGELGYLPYEQWEKVKESPLVKVIQQPSMRLFICSIHNQRPPTNDAHFRRAILYAFDYESWIKHIQHGEVDRNIGPIPNPMWGSLDPKTEFGYSYNLDKAKGELKQCTVDWKKYLPLEQVPLAGYPMCIQGAEFLQACLRRIGIETVITPKPWAMGTEITRKEETTPTFWWFWRSTYYPDPHSWIGEMFDSEKWGSWPTASWYKNPKVDEILHKAARVIEKEEREKLYKEAGRLVVGDAAALCIHNEKWTGTFHKDMRGMRFSPVGDANEWRWFYWA
jgi:peptide/nickel transport system substrate-binding protein